MLELENPQPAKLRRLLSEARTVAVVGLSSNGARDSYRVAEYLIQHGYRVIPVNPAVQSVLGEKSYPDLESIPEPVDVVDLFRRPEYVPDIAAQAISIGAKALWLQLGVRNGESARMAKEAGLTVIQDACIKVEHSRLMT